MKNILGVIGVPYIAADYAEHPRRETHVEEVERLLVAIETLLYQRAVIDLQFILHTIKIARIPRYCITLRKFFSSAGQPMRRRGRRGVFSAELLSKSCQDAVGILMHLTERDNFLPEIFDGATDEIDGIVNYQKAIMHI